MKIAIFGSGNVGTALAGGWVKAGHEVCFGSREPQGAKISALLARLGPHACADNLAGAARWGEVIVLATPWHTTRAVLEGLGDLGGKVLLDCINPIGADGQLQVGLTTSAAEQIAGWARNTRVVKAFNMTGAGNMANPGYPEGKASMLFCGDDAAARDVAARLIGDLGMDPVDVGPLSMARFLEPMAMVWIGLAYRQGLGPNIAFRLMKR
jgi:hypothetical protein